MLPMLAGCSPLFVPLLLLALLPLLLLLLPPLLPLLRSPLVVPHVCW